MEAEVVVVGGGAIGVTAAYELAERGARVTLLERGESLAAACSSGNAGLICPSHSHPLATPAALRQGLTSLLRSDSGLCLRPRVDTLGWLARYVAACRGERAHRSLSTIRGLSSASLQLHARLAPLGTSFQRHGILSLYETETGLAAARNELAGSGLGGRSLSAGEARELEPALTDGVAGCLFHPDEAHVDPLRYVRALGEAATAAGATIRTLIEARALRRHRGSVAVVTDDGELRPETVVLAAGAWSGKLAAGLGVFVPLTGGKGYHVDLEPAAGDPRLPLLIQEARCAVTPLDDRLRLTGTLEVSGLDASVSRRRVEAIRRAVARVLIGQRDRRVLDVWAGLRPITPDGLPVIGRSEQAPGLVLATGHAMKGVSLAPVTALLVAQLAADEPPTHDVAPLSPDRFRRLTPLR